MEEVDRLARIIWNYHHMHHQLKKADCIMVLGSHDERVAAYAAQLYHDGWAPLIVCSGGLGRHTQGLWDETEASHFARIIRSTRVPADAILTEDTSTNTGENILLSKALLMRSGINPKRVIVVHKPYMERRAYATIQKQWPDVDAIITSPPFTLENYPNGTITKDALINIMVGDLQRIKVYGENGFQAYQEIPGDVWDAYEKLVAAGYVRELISQ